MKDMTGQDIRNIFPARLYQLARILAITEAYSAMIGRRPYRNALSKDVAKKRLSEQAGKQFDPQLVKAFILALDKESK